jgi:hypothetical protein
MGASAAKATNGSYRSYHQNHKSTLHLLLKCPRDRSQWCIVLVSMPLTDDMSVLIAYRRCSKDPCDYPKERDCSVAV